MKEKIILIVFMVLVFCLGARSFETELLKQYQETVRVYQFFHDRCGDHYQISWGNASSTSGMWKCLDEEAQSLGSATQHTYASSSVSGEPTGHLGGGSGNWPVK